MNQMNRTSVTKFILLGLTEDTKLQLPLFVFFLLVYIMTVLGNISIITLIRISAHLHTPMYFLLSHMSFVDICYSTVITPNMLANVLSSKKTISFSGCMTQMFLFGAMGSVEVFILAGMSYDRFVAICNPLLYTAIMTKKMCAYLVGGAYVTGCLHSLLHAICLLRLSFCDSNRITHFYCDVPPLLKLSCSDISLNVALLIFVTGGLILGPLALVLVSYAYILYTILKVRSSESRWTAISTCCSHFLCVTLCFGTLIFMYIRPKSKYATQQDHVASVFYAVIIPMLNPLIYSLRNKDVKEALRKLMSGISAHTSLSYSFWKSASH
ncbi:olfactory receptor 8D1-like [Pleurodeles waltl]|uniref:olfactory receptor 8D1-like n=1 Tax=Pleurodeles waltl TaxID=8319 RepID=UPI0037095C23